MLRPLRIGISAAFMHADPERPLFKGKTLKYVEQQLSHWIMSEGALAYMIPAPVTRQAEALDAFAMDLDALVLQGGVDVAPQSYRETPLQPEWAGDKTRDDYEIALFRAFLNARKPVLGICRGLQLLNVALGGSLYQDIATQVPGAFGHRDWNIYDQNFHDIQLKDPTLLSSLYPATTTARVCSVHHQAIKTLAESLVAEAFSVEDDLVEAVRLEGPVWVYGVQWHPEWHDANDPKLMNGRILLGAFFEAARQRRAEDSPAHFV